MQMSLRRNAQKQSKKQAYLFLLSFGLSFQTEAKYGQKTRRIHWALFRCF
jgi:hypothetical protein